MSIRSLMPCFMLSVVFISSCDSPLGLEIMNTGDNDIEVTVDSQSQRVPPGLSFSADYPPLNHPGITVADGSCHYKYTLPDLNQEPWRSLIGNSLKFRWFSGGRMGAYPPTPDVRILNNPQRASSDEVRTIQPLEASCG